MKQAILRALEVIGAFLFWNPRVMAFVAVLRELVEKFWPEMEALMSLASARKRTAFLKADDRAVMGLYVAQMKMLDPPVPIQDRDRTRK